MERPDHLLPLGRGVAVGRRDDVRGAGEGRQVVEGGVLDGHDFLEGMPPRALILVPLDGEPGQPVQGRVDAHRVPGEREAHVEAQVVGGHHDLVAGGEPLRQELAELLDGPRPVRLAEVEVVDIDHQVEAVPESAGRGFACGLRSHGAGRLVRRADRGAVDRLEVRDLDPFAVLVELEIPFVEARDRLAVLVRHIDVHIDDVDLDDVPELGRLGRIDLLGGERRRERRQQQRDKGQQAGPHDRDPSLEPDRLSIFRKVECKGQTISFPWKTGPFRPQKLTLCPISGERPSSL